MHPDQIYLADPVLPCFIAGVWCEKLHLTDAEKVHAEDGMSSYVELVQVGTMQRVTLPLFMVNDDGRVLARGMEAFAVLPTEELYYSQMERTAESARLFYHKGFGYVVTTDACPYSFGVIVHEKPLVPVNGPRR